MLPLGGGIVVGILLLNSYGSSCLGGASSRAALSSSASPWRCSIAGPIRPVPPARRPGRRPARLVGDHVAARGRRVHRVHRRHRLRGGGHPVPDPAPGGPAGGCPRAGLRGAQHARVGFELPADHHRRPDLGPDRHRDGHARGRHRGDHRRGRQASSNGASTDVAGATADPHAEDPIAAALGADRPSWRESPRPAAPPRPATSAAGVGPARPAPILPTATDRCLGSRSSSPAGRSAWAGPVAGGNVPSLDGAAILVRTPGLEEYADVVPIDRGLTPASHTFADLMWLGEAIRDALSEEANDGVVVVQGTDTIEETAFAWDLVIDSPKPVVVTGAMRASHEEGYDGPANLRRAVAAAASLLRDAGVVVSLAGTLEAADDVTKMHTTAFDTFRSPNRGSLGTGGGGRCRDRHSSRVAPPSPAGTVRWRPGRARGGRHLDGRRDGRRRGRCRRTRHRRGRHGRRQHLGRDAGCIRASDRWRCRGRARLAMPGRRGLDRLCLPRWWRHVGRRHARRRTLCAIKARWPLPWAWVRGSGPRSSRRSSPTR